MSLRRRLNFSPRQVRAARALLDWSAADLAARAGLELEAVELFEFEDGELSDAELQAIATALYRNGSGVIALGADRAGEGVRLLRPPCRIDTGVYAGRHRW